MTVEQFSGTIGRLNGTHDHQWVTERIALGSAVTRFEHLNCLVSEHISLVLDCRMSNSHPELYEHRREIIHVQCGTLDDGQSKTADWFHRGIFVILNELSRRDSRILVHCLLGVSRGPAMIYAILRVLGASASEAELRIMRAREILRTIKYQSDAERAILDWPGSPYERQIR
jgi:protein-tyrosine phosphatase